MAKRKNDQFVTHVKGKDELLQKTQQLRAEGFIPYVPKVRTAEAADQQWGDYIHGELRGGTSGDCSAQRKQVPTLYFSSGNEVKEGNVSDIGTPGLGYMEWGFGNRLPNVVALLTGMLPYTAAAQKFNVDMLAGLGPQPMYEITQYVGGNITTKKIRYKDAGIYLRGRIVDRQREIVNVSTGQAATVLGDSVAELKAVLQEELKALQADLKEWERTAPEVQDFIDRNNLAHTWLSLAIDQVTFGICFPELLLNQLDIDDHGKEVKTENWSPKVIGLSHRPCHTTRLERMDKNGHINYVYCSNKWLDPAFVDNATVAADSVSGTRAIPTLHTTSPLATLTETIRKARTEKVSVANRPTRFVLPSAYPTAGRPYYPTPAWHSIFGGDIYEYISTIISDRLTRKKNSNIIGRVIYLNQDYLKMLSVQTDKEGNVKSMAEWADAYYEEINKWLSNRDNAGQSLIAFTFQGTDGKEHRSFEIVEIESNSKNSAAANEKETAEVASIVFMPFLLDGRLLGSSPLSLVGTGGGTDLRERFLLRQILMSPTQNIMLKPLEVLSRYNHWDRNLVWDIRREVMTTLDNSKTGVTEAEIN